MYSKDFWDSVYKDHFYDAPWMSDLCANEHLKIMEEYLPADMRGLRLLDYGCGNGVMANHFYLQGVKVALADISGNLVNWLNKTYASTDMSIFEVSTPMELVGKGKYDVIIACSLFHHIAPQLWTSFMEGFAELMLPGAIMVIAGWDEVDEIIKEDQRTARFTGQTTWPLNDLVNNIEETGCFDIEVNVMREINLMVFKTSRKFRYYKLRKK